MSTPTQANQAKKYDVTIDGETHTVWAVSNQMARIVAEEEFGRSKSKITSKLWKDETEGEDDDEPTKI